MLCSHCGGKLPENMAFCGNCGAKADAAAPVKEAPPSPTAQQNTAPGHQVTPKKKMHPGAIVAIVLSAVVLVMCVIPGVILFGVILGGLPMMGTTMSPEQLERHEVTNFVGMHADNLLNDRAFGERYNFEVQKEDSETHPAGVVFRQSPMAGRNVAVDEDGRVAMLLFVSS